MNDRISPLLAWCAYLFGFALILTAAIDLFTTVWPPRPGDIAWRYGFLGLAAGYLQTPTLGLALIAGTAIWKEHVLLLKAAGMISMLTALALLGIIGIFGLDVLAMRQLRPAEAQAGVLMGGAFQEVKYVIATGVFALLGQGCLKTAKRIVEGAARRPRKPGIVSAARPSRSASPETSTASADKAASAGDSTD